MSFRQTTVSGFPAVALRSAELEVVAVPSLGMKLTNLRRLERPGVALAERPDSAGAAAAWCVLRGDRRQRWLGRVLSHRGAVSGPRGTPWYPAAAGPWRAVELHPGPARSTITMKGPLSPDRPQGPLFPYEFHRQITLDAQEPVVRFRYRLRHTGDTPFPWIWSSHPLSERAAGICAHAAGMSSQVKLAAVHGRDDLAGRRRGELAWCRRWRDAGSFTFPGERRLGAQGSSATSGRRGSHGADRSAPGRAARVRGRSGRRCPRWGVWINCRGWAPPGTHALLQPGPGAMYRRTGPARSRR